MADSFGNSEEAIRSLVDRKGEGIGFAIAIDDPGESERGYQGVFRGKTVEAYLGGAQAPAMPTGRKPRCRMSVASTSSVTVEKRGDATISGNIKHSVGRSRPLSMSSGDS